MRTQQKRREARTKRHNRQLQKEGIIPQVILDTEIDKIITRKQFMQELKHMSKTATRKPKQFSKRTDAYTAWLITFGHRWVLITEVKHWNMWEVGNELLRGKYIECTTKKDGKAYARLLTPEELECQQ